MTDGIYTCDVNDYVFLLSKQDGKVTRSCQDWFYWWLSDNGIDYTRVTSLLYNELQQTIYTEEVDFEGSVVKRYTEGKYTGLVTKKRRGLLVDKDYPVIVEPPQVLIERWDWLMEEIRGSEREVGAAA